MLEINLGPVLDRPSNAGRFDAMVDLPFVSVADADSGNFNTGKCAILCPGPSVVSVQLGLRVGAEPAIPVNPNIIPRARLQWGESGDGDHVSFDLMHDAGIQLPGRRITVEGWLERTSLLPLAWPLTRMSVAAGFGALPRRAPLRRSTRPELIPPAPAFGSIWPVPKHARSVELLYLANVVLPFNVIVVEQLTEPTAPSVVERDFWLNIPITLGPQTRFVRVQNMTPAAPFGGPPPIANLSLVFNLQP